MYVCVCADFYIRFVHYQMSILYIDIPDIPKNTSVLKVNLFLSWLDLGIIPDRVKLRRASLGSSGCEHRGFSTAMASAGSWGLKFGGLHLESIDSKIITVVIF